jgi:hypothetical protein
MKITNIKWETDGQKVELPDTIVFDKNYSEDEVSDYLSDEYGYLHNGFTIND